MKPSAIRQALPRLLAKNRAAFIWGAPGVGKSDLIATIAKDLKLELRDVRLSLLDPVDLKGFPTISASKKQMTWLPADFLPTEGEGLLFLDEMNSAPQSVQAAAYQLVLNRKIGDYTLLSWNVVLMDSYRMSLDPEVRKRELERAAMSGQRLPMFVDGDGPPAKPIRIGKNVWIGFDSIVLPGVTIGDGAIVGARSVVVEDVEPYTVVAGNPARLIRRLDI